ncbi:nucleoporin Nup188 [Drosophila tropicalis]|uniref:nucleoporin Nup188 n=1 Tax=Drosophila tropicalis TaxID=46794 RepID=UPI0035ABC499
MPAVEKRSNIHDWKRLWQMVSGIHYETPQETVGEELLRISSELQDGVLQFKPKKASNVELATLLKEKKQEKLLPFTETLQEMLNLESTQCWDLLCYYLTKEYRGSSSLLTQLISTDTNMTKLLEDIRHYYSLERMIVLKIMKNILVFYGVPNHPYQKQYIQIVDKLTLEKLLQSYLEQLESLINELPPRKLMAGECYHSADRLINWSERNARETNEVLHILLLLSEHMPMGLKEIKRMFSAFKQHSFGRIYNNLNEGNIYHQDLIKSLNYSEHMLLLKSFDSLEHLPSNEIEQFIAELNVEIASMHLKTEHGPLLLAWMLLRLRLTNDADDPASLLFCRQLGKRSVDLKCFIEMHSILKHPMFSDDSLLSRIVRKTIYNLLGYLCDLFDGDGSCSQYEGIYDLLCELLSWPQLAKDFCSQDGGIRSLYNSLLENFPLDFAHLSKLALALTKAGQGTYIKNQLESLPILAVLYDEREHRLRELGPDEYELTARVKPFAHIDFEIEAGTTCTAVQHPSSCFMHFRTQVNYFHALHHEINCLLKETPHLNGEFESSERIKRVEAGLLYLEAAVQRVKSIDGISSQMVHPTEMCVDLLNKFKSLQYPPARLMASCLSVCTALLHLVDEEIFTRIRHLGILPSITASTGSDVLNDYKLYASGSEVCFESRFLGSIIDNVEKKSESYDFLLAYLHFLRTYTKLKRNRFTQVEIPGLIFLLRDVFPHIHAWHFKKQEDKNRIYFEVLSFICDILDLLGSSSNPTPSVSADLLLKVCVYSLLNLENGLVLLRFVGVGNAFVQYSMELETNWMQQQPHGLMMLVRLSMRILMQLLRMKESVYGKTGENSLSPLEALIYTQPKQRDTLRIIPTVCSYMSNIFDRWLPILSCRLLKRIALEFNMSLLACLDMEADQIRLTFMQKMPDDLESDEIKIAILELVDACIAKQPGVTEAFFKVNYKEDKRAQSFFGKEIYGKTTPNIGESIVTYMREFLDALEQEPLTIQQMLPSRIMNIFHSLWKNNLQMLVDDLTKEKGFWNKLCSPLFTELQTNLRIYTQLINMVSIEIYTGDDKNGALKKVLEKFFEKKWFEKWLDYVFVMPKEPAKQLSSSDDLPDWICCLQSFKDLIIILLKKQPKFMTIPEPQFKFLAKNCLNVLVDRAHYIDDMRPFIMLAELYVFILLKFNHSYTNSPQDEEELMENLLQLMNRICSSYEDLHVRAKEACLAIITKCAHLHTNLLIKDTSIALRFLNSVVSIICMELQHMENSVSLDHQSVKPNEYAISENSLILCLNLLKAVATIFHNDGPGNWDLPFVSVRLFQRLMRCISHTLPLHSKQVLSAQLLDVLIVFAKSHCSVEFLHCDVGECLWLNLLPPHELLESRMNEFSKPQGADNERWTVEEWWPIYARGIELVNIIYDKHKKSFLSDVLQFIGIHEVYLVESLLLVKQSLEPAAMQLIKAAITLVASLSEHEMEWRADHPSSLANIMRAVKGLLCHSSSLFHQHRNLKCLLAGRRSQLEILRSTDSILIDDEIITACNELTYVIIYCVKSLQQFSPDLLDLLCNTIYSPHKWDSILDVTFGASKLNDQNVTLTFGMLLNMVNIFVKALNLQNHGFHELPLNKLNNRDIGHMADQSNTTSSIDSSINPSSRTFSKNLSTNSISSVACSSSELLSNLDGQLCLVALEHLLMFVASQGIYMIRLPELEPRWKQIIRRDVNSELLSYHEFVRRKVIVDYRDSRCQWVRRKHGLLKIKFHDPARSLATRNTDVVRRVSSSNLNELRVNVVRRQHLQHQQRTNFDMTRVLSPIGAAAQNAQHVAASTPSLDVAVSRKRLYADGEYATEDDTTTELELHSFSLPTEPGFCELSQVQLVEEDYLQLMSNLFSVIPQSD